jgi:hypothetical protein
MGEIFHLKAGDTRPELEAVLEDQNDEPIDLTGADVSIRLLEPRGGDEVLNEPMTVSDATGGTVRYVWADGDTGDPGRYRTEFVVTYADGSEETFPNDGYHDVVITG